MNFIGLKVSKLQAKCGTQLVQDSGHRNDKMLINRIDTFPYLIESAGSMSDGVSWCDD